MDTQKIDSLFNEPAHFRMSIPELVQVLGASERRIRQLIRELDLDTCGLSSCPDLIFKKGNLHIFYSRTPYYVFRTSIIKLANALMKERSDAVQAELDRIDQEIAAALALQGQTIQDKGDRQ